MANPSPPRSLSAEIVDATKVTIRWKPPTDNGGFPIDTYQIQRSLNGAAFVNFGSPINSPTITADDTTLTVNDNGRYKVSATNDNNDTSAFSNIDGATIASSEAQTIQQLLINGWDLTGELAKTTTGTMTEPVHFFARGQVPGNKFPKAITVQKINAFENEKIVEHPKFFEQSETFEITCFLQVPDSFDDVFSFWIDLMQQMTSKVTEILKTVYSPSTLTGQFFRTNIGWEKDDTFFPDDPELTRTLRFTLTRILSNDTQVFLGFGGVLVFDTSASQGDKKPLADYTFAQATNVTLEEGFDQIPILTKDPGKGVGVPQLVRGMFSGTFSAIMFAKKDDIIGVTTEKLQNIYKPQALTEVIHQNAEVVFLTSNPNTEAIDTVSLITITVGGTGYTSAPSVTISGGGGTGATATAIVTGGIVVSVVIDNPGSGYTTNPAVMFGGPGINAAADATRGIVTLTKTSHMKIDRLVEIDEDESLVSYRVHGVLSKPTTYGVA